MWRRITPLVALAVIAMPTTSHAATVTQTAAALRKAHRISGFADTADMTIIDLWTDTCDALDGGASWKSAMKFRWAPADSRESYRAVAKIGVRLFCADRLPTSTSSPR